MTDIEAKLEAYRLRKKREKQIENTKKLVTNLTTFGFLRMGKETSTSRQVTAEDENSMQTDEQHAPSAETSSDNSRNERLKHLIQVKYSLYLLLWLSLLLIAIVLQFGIVYFVLSMLLFIWLNTRTRPKAPGEMSAYSVFNPNCEAIHGTLKAEQFENELRYGAVSSL